MPHCLLHLLKRYADRSTDVGVALLSQSYSQGRSSLVVCSHRRSVWPAKMSQPNRNRLHTLTPETSSSPGIEVNWKFIRGRLERGW